MNQVPLAYIHLSIDHLLVYQDGFWGIYDSKNRMMAVPLRYTHYTRITGGVYLFTDELGNHQMFSVGRVNLVDIAA